MADSDEYSSADEESAETKGMKKWLKREFTIVNQQTEKNHELLSDIKDRIEQLEYDNAKIENLCDGLQEENRKLKATVGVLDEKILQLELCTRKDNLRFFNIPEAKSAEEDLRNFIWRNLHIDDQNIDFSIVYRVGRHSNDTRPRCILGRFVRRSDVERVKAAAPNLRGTRFVITEDLPPEWAELRRLAYPVHVRPARQEGKKVRWRGPQLFIDGREVTLSLTGLREAKSKSDPPPPPSPMRPGPSSSQPPVTQSQAPSSDSETESERPTTPSTILPPREQRQQSRAKNNRGKGKQLATVGGGAKTKTKKQQKSKDESHSSSSSNSTLTQSATDLPSRLRAMAERDHRNRHDQEETVSEPEMTTRRHQRSSSGVNTRSQTQLARFFKPK